MKLQPEETSTNDRGGDKKEEKQKEKLTFNTPVVAKNLNTDLLLQRVV